MNCSKCGAENSESAKFCYSCGSKLLKENNEDVYQNFSTQQSADGENISTGGDFKKLYAELKSELEEGINQKPHEQNDTVCPFCKEPDCTPLQKSTTEVSSKGYKWGSGCCGMFLLGPFGLLCGLCGTGSAAKVTDELWWTCKKCGKQHIALEDALKKWETAVDGLIGSGISAGSAFLIIRWLELGLLSFFGAILTVFVPALGIYSIHSEISEELGQPLLNYLTPEQKKDTIQTFMVFPFIGFPPI